MSNRNQRIVDAINNLVRKYQVDIPGEDEAAAAERQSDSVQAVTEILKK